MKKSQKSLISVVMSVKNGMPYLENAVNSILNQSYKNFEFIIVDDASDDNTPNFLNIIKDNRVILIKNKKSLGLAASLNKSLRIAKGEYIARMDADDISLPNRIEIQVNFMNNHKTVDLCGTWVALIDQNNNKIGKIHYPISDKEIKKTLRKITPLIHPTWLIRSKVFHKLNGYNSDWDFVEDYEFLLRARKFKMANIPQELLLWRSVSSRRSKQDIQKMYLKNFQLKLKYFREGKLDLLYLPNLVRSFISTYLFPKKLKIYFNEKARLI